MPYKKRLRERRIRYRYVPRYKMPLYDWRTARLLGVSKRYVYYKVKNRKTRRWHYIKVYFDKKYAWEFQKRVKL